mmetsp:Transcript_25033/g.52409  ORF Transcript_25033/g.52409 Transcript_25033/m.52409 type:complete len:428 (-) Transcript_25033:1322-2605(-)
MSNRPTSPTPSSTPINSKSAGGGTSESLSSNALYTPLSHYNNIETQTPSDKTNSQKHSLTIQTSTTLKEASLLSFLGSIATQIKTSHPHSYPLYRGLGGAIARHGTGDNDRVGSLGSVRNSLEGKLSNRSLVLVGGGVHTHASSSSGIGAVGGSGGGTDGEGVFSTAGGVESGLARLGASQNVKGGKRERKRAGGIGVFGCVSNKKRKRVLAIMQSGAMRYDRDMDKSVCNNDKSLVVKDISFQSPSVDESKVQEKVTHVIETLHKMWNDYMKQLLSPVIENIQSPSHSKSPESKTSQQSSVTQTADTAVEDKLTLQHRQQISILLAQAEHVGMSATIVSCSSRRHLVPTRCVVVNESKEMWQIARMKRISSCPKKKVGSEQALDDKGKSNFDTRWKILHVPKRGSTLEVKIPLGDEGGFVTVQMET